MPNEDQLIEKLTIVRVGNSYKDYDPAAVFAAEMAVIEEKQRLKKEEEKQKLEAFISGIKEQNPDVQTSASGLMYVITDVGSGPKPEIGQQVLVDYAVYLPDDN